MAVKLLAFAGSVRKESFNKKTVKIAAAAAKAAGAEVKFIDLIEYPLPLFDQDLEAKDGLTFQAKELKALFKEYDGFLIACPEYNSTITPLLKNTIDWMSRKEGKEPELIALKGKTVALLSASPGELGGLRGLVTVRALLSHLGLFVLPDQVAVKKAEEAFDDKGQLKDKKLQERVEKLAKALVEITAKLKA